ncbi:hypothetical protein [Cytobacillus sp. IB215316]|uniref:hypothetical protein n=1 Tax=Cytobacillus sp. IB215316 TaxID=3097354 RepID=UPI002A0CAFF8|nr:hypothetical protein [Cytobacillus sp. IB215316]MDX8361717.1 hypothetical protein [Cytobacillus sp. IB215316]
MNNLLDKLCDVKLIKKRTGERHDELEIQYVNISEPEYCRYYLLLIKDNKTDTAHDRFSVNNICVYNFKTKCYESIQGLYAHSLMEQIMYIILFKLKYTEHPVLTRVLKEVN